MRTRRKVLLAPITVTPSKPLTPSHLKGLLWTDVMFRATAQLAEVTYRYSQTTYHQTEQTLGFWEFLDRTQGDIDYASLSEEEIGDLYVSYRAEGSHPSADVLRPYAEAVESDGWVHPASTRILRLWAGHYAQLGMHDPGLLAHQPPALGLEDMVERLVSMGMGLDQRDCGGPVYLDATRFGLPLRQILGPDGRPNYLACALRELLPLATEYDEVVFLYDPELDPDYQLLERVLTGTGSVVVHRVPVGRVPIDGKITSARAGGWHDHTAGALLRSVGADYEPAARRLGMRLYFIATLGPGQRQSFHHDLLRKSLARAERLLSRAAAAPEWGKDELISALGRHRSAHTHVDPYRLTASLLGKRCRVPDRELLSTVFL